MNCTEAQGDGQKFKMSVHFRTGFGWLSLVFLVRKQWLTVYPSAHTLYIVEKIHKMKLKLLIFSLLCSLGPLVHAQDWSTDVYTYGEDYPGYVIDENGEKIEGFITYKDRYSLQNEVVFYKEKGNKKTREKYKTADLKEYKVADKLYHCIHYSGGLLKKPIRGNLLLSEGCINQYIWYNREDNYLIMQRGSEESDEEFYNRMYPSVWVLKRADSDEARSHDYFALKFAQKMAEWVADNPALAEKVKNKEKGYGMLSMVKIIDEYNAECQ